MWKWRRTELILSVSESLARKCAWIWSNLPVSTWDCVKTNWPCRVLSPVFATLWSKSLDILLLWNTKDRCLAPGADQSEDSMRRTMENEQIAPFVFFVHNKFNNKRSNSNQRRSLIRASVKTALNGLWNSLNVANKRDEEEEYKRMQYFTLKCVWTFCLMANRIRSPVAILETEYF